MKTPLIVIHTLLLMSFVALGRDPLVGDWKWFTGTVVSFSSKGEAVNSNGHKGTWERLPTRVSDYQYTINWEGGRFVDTVTLSKDRKSIAGSNQLGGSITADRWAKGK
jgi:hypothetical protein